jgi:hypothetical protein
VSDELQVGDFVASKGEIKVEKMGQVHVTSFELAKVTAIDGDRIRIAPGSFDGLGRWGQRRDFRICARSDLRKVEPPS